MRLYALYEGDGILRPDAAIARRPRASKPAPATDLGKQYPGRSASELLGIHVHATVEAARDLRSAELTHLLQAPTPPWRAVESRPRRRGGLARTQEYQERDVSSLRPRTSPTWSSASVIGTDRLRITDPTVPELPAQALFYRWHHPHSPAGQRLHHLPVYSSRTAVPDAV